MTLEQKIVELLSPEARNAFHWDHGKPYTPCSSHFGDGWVDAVARAIEEMYAVSGGTVRIEQVKEKFGGLRICFDAPYEHWERLLCVVAAAERWCWSTCEECGSRDNVRTTRGYIRRLCPACR